MEKEQRLNEVLEKVKRYYNSENFIHELKAMIDSEYNLEYEEERPFQPYFNALWHTKKDHLSFLMEEIKHPNKRAILLQQTIESFEKDIETELRRLSQ